MFLRLYLLQIRPFSKEKEVITKYFLSFVYHLCLCLKDSVCSSQELKLRFMSGMHSFAKVTAAAVATAFDLSRFKTACDLGGKCTKVCITILDQI